MASGARAGLQSAAQVSAALRKKAAAERARLQQAEGEDDGGGGGGASSKTHETIYRDATGRIVNAALARAEARKKEEDKEKAKREAEEAVRGDVQRREAKVRKGQLADAKFMDVARYKDDVEMNRELKRRERWNDPAAGFLTKNDEDEDEIEKDHDGGRGGARRRRRKPYKGGAEPNRYGIRPGGRWDGVDRSNGFERSWFDARNKVKNRKELEYAWQMDE